MGTLTFVFSLALLATPAMAQNYYYVVPTNPNAQVSSFPTQQFDPTMARRQELMDLQAERMRLENEQLRQRLQQQR